MRTKKEKHVKKSRNYFDHSKKQAKGASLPEYGILLGLVGVACIAAVVGTGEEVRDSYTHTSSTLNGTMAAAGLGGAEPAEPEEPRIADCYEPSNVGYVGGAGWAGDCEGMLIVDNSSIRVAASSIEGGDETFQIAHTDGNTYTFADDSYDIFTGQVTNLSRLFEGTSFNGDIGYWTTDNVTNFWNTFSGSSFAQDIDSWNVSAGRDFSGMFADADSFNQPLPSWRPTSVISMNGMFAGNDAFNQDISGWPVWPARFMNQMFHSATAFNQDLSAWCLSGTTENDDFDTNTPAWTEPKPNWGTC
jgi:Flp pilus assembly pilin Flp